MSIFDYTDYKEYIRAQIERAGAQRGYRTELAKVAGCQKSFFSQVLRSEAQLTRDHVAELARFWGLDVTETDFFLTLLDRERTGSSYLRSVLDKKLKSLRSNTTKLTSALVSSKAVPAEAQAIYYSAWYWSAIHLALSIEGLGTSTALSQRLGLPTETIHSALTKLERLGLVRQSQGKWAALNVDMHLPSDSFMNELNHTHWRSRAITDVQRQAKDSVHYTSVFAVSRNDAKKIQALLLDAVLEGRKLIPPSKEEDLYCLNADFFRV